MIQEFYEESGTFNIEDFNSLKSRSNPNVIIGFGTNQNNNSMVQAEELRIGNYVNYPFGGMQKIRNGDDIDNIYEAAGEPIPLTPELLEICGFTTEKDNWYTKKYFTNCKEQAEVNIISINSKTFRCGICNDEDYSYAMTGKELLYLHQLQNFYRWLTGEELPVTL